MTQLTIHASAWLREDCGPDDITDGRAFRALAYFSPGQDMAEYGYCFFGSAVITVDGADDKTLIDNKVASLKAQKSQILGEAQAKATELDSKIQKLLAINYTPSGSQT